MKKILFLLLSTIAMYGQIPADATPLENIQITNNVQDDAATKVTVQDDDGVQNWLPMANLPVSTATTNALDLKTTLSAGAFSGFAVTNNGDGTISVGSGIAYLRATNDQYAPLIKYPIAAYNNIPLVDNLNNYIVVSYNGGSPALVLNTTGIGIDTQTTSIAIAAARVGTTVHYISLVGSNSDPNAKLRNRYLQSEGIRRVAGLAISATGRKIATTAGITYSGLIRLDVAAMNTNTSDTYTLAYNNGSTWTRVTGQTDINNTQYNNAGTLTALSNNNFRTDYIYALVNSPSKLYVILGNTQYNTIGAARLAPTPSSLPVELEQLGVLIGRAIIEKDAITMEMASPFVQDFAAGAIENHNDLAGLQGGTAGEYNHLTNAQISEIAYTSVASAWVASNGNNSTAELGNQRKPFLTIDAALDALPASGGVVNIGIGTFNSPTLAKVKDNVSFLGSGKPVSNMTITYIDEITKPTITSPTNLVGGTILNGKFDVSLKNNIKVKNLGVDVGKTWVDTFNGGVAVDGFVSAQNISFPSQPTSIQTRGLVLENISVLGYSATSLFHNTLVENTFSPQISNLSTYFNTYGLVLKTTGANVVNYDAHGHNGDAIIVKADTYAYSQNINLTNLYISSIGNYDCAGITLSGGSGNLQRVNISNVNIEFTKNAIKSDGVVDEVNISNVNIKSTSERAIYLPSTVKNANLTNINQNGTGSGYNGIQLESDSNGVKTISNSKSSNTLGVGFSFTATGTGKVIANGLDSYNNTTSYGISGNVYGSNITKNTAQTGELIFDSYGKIQSLRSFSAPTGGIDSNIGILSSNTSGFSGIGILAGNTSSSFIHFGDTDNSGEGQIEFYHGDNSMNFKVSGNVPVSITSSGVNLTGTPTAPTAAAGTNTTQIATTAFVMANARPYKTYVAKISQTGTSNPTSIVLENTTGLTFTLTRTLTGFYEISPGVSMGSNLHIAINKEHADALVTLQHYSDSIIRIITTDLSGNPVDTKLANNSFELRIYP